MLKSIINNKKFFISCKESRIENARSFYGCFYIGPLDSGQSFIIANALRRILLFNISGIAITSAKIQGVQHEYCSIPGVHDSILDILLNLKEIVLKSSSFIQKPQLGYLKVQGPGVVRAKNLKLPPCIHCVDPEQYIASLSENGFLNIKFKIEKGKNYININQNPLDINTSLYQTKEVKNKLFYSESNELPIDANFLSINKVNYNIEIYDSSALPKNQDSEVLLSLNNNTLPNFNFVSSSSLNKEDILQDKKALSYEFQSSIQKNTNASMIFNQTKEFQELNNVIVLEVWTNGSIHPRQAVYYAFKKLTRLFLKLERIQIFNSNITQSFLEFEKQYEKIFKKLEYDFHYKNKKILKKQNSFFKISSLLTKS
uniref:DNA-directed RNA polymerase n=1 Tax=Treubaria triappendiculata TaxID=1755147 RepID=A0A0S2LMK1_TRETR|nr:alpha subunit of RNA polymerase [Treubaria triappendiculata]ALO62661.1 alpha subunit of RNA polymerase [Treubaria triappendiculata]